MRRSWRSRRSRGRSRRQEQEGGGGGRSKREEQEGGTGGKSRREEQKGGAIGGRRSLKRDAQELLGKEREAGRTALGGGGNRRNKETEGRGSIQRGISKRKARAEKGLKTEGEVAEEEQDGEVFRRERLSLSTELKGLTELS